jgi:acetolactate synthase-1/2/3 large subunit
MGEQPSQSYTLFEIPGPRQTLVHVHPDAGELGRIYRPQLAIQASPTAFAAALEGLQPPNDIRWRADTARAHAEWDAWTGAATPQPGGVNLGEIMVWLRDNLPADAFMCSGAGNFSTWVHRFYRLRRFATQLAPTAGSMGYGFPAAVAAQRLHPERTVVCVAGDGDFLMTGQEFATAVQYGLPVITLVYDNGMYGTIRAHQERHYPERVIGTALKNPDFAAYAKAFGGFGITVEKTGDFPTAFKAAQASGRPALINLKVDPQAISPGASIDMLREKALAQRQ